MTSLVLLLLASTSVLIIQGCYIFPSDVPDPCAGVTCGPGEQCRPTADARSFTCDCPTSCPSYGDHEGSRPRCASDAKDYPGECEMRKAACEAHKNITFKYYGKCDPCAGVSCPDPEICQLDAHRNPTCRCAEPCPLEFSPVCASDGKTYSNQCQMNRESCRARKQLKIIFKGQCSTGLNPCAEVECRHGAECRVEGGGAVCTCPPACEPVLRPVCGSDGNTHDSECELRRTACLLGQEIRVQHSGACGSNGVCAGRVCPHGGECVSSGERAVCRCPRCSNEFAPVCGSDGISYGNRCKLQLEACHHRRNIKVLYDGPCNGCENKKCENYAVCESDGVSEASCVCPKHCEEGTETEEVCGSDNNTYSSICALRNESCNEKRQIVVKHMGSCESCRSVSCPAGTWCARGTCSCATACAAWAREPVCSDTRRTFVHECALQKAACEATLKGETPHKLAYYGECSDDNDGKNSSVKITELTNDIGGEEVSSDTSAAVCERVTCAYDATCAVDSQGQPRCACLFDCAAAAAAASGPVCASDLRLYPTLCHMKLEACHRQEDLRLRPLALCKGLEFRPCGTDEPLTDASGVPLDCGGGPHRKDCPPDSYCHHTARLARCCRNDKSAGDKKGCQESWHGCCSDGVTAAAGPGGAGCPAACGCHRLGAAADTCDGAGVCRCRRGVAGDKCDRCLPGYWGLATATAKKQLNGCTPCGCSAFGSVREDCEQMTGRCVCKPGIQGSKCTVCSHHEHSLGPRGCYDPESTQLPATSCEQMSCYFGAICVMRGGLATCECGTAACPTEPAEPPVCGSDARTYLSACHLRHHACRTQADIVLQAFGPCPAPAAAAPVDPHVHRRENFTISNTTNTECEDDFTVAPVRKKIAMSNEIEDYAYSSYEDYLSEKLRDSEVYKVPLFDGQSSMTASMRLPGTKFDIWAEVTAVCGEGTLLSAYGKKDHLWLGLVDDKVILRWDAGSGPLQLSVGKVRLERRSKIAARKYRKDAMLKMGSLRVVGRSRGRMTALNVEPLVHIGLPPENVPKLFNVTGFVGCVHRLRVSGHDIIPPSQGVDLNAFGLKACTPANIAGLLCP